MKKRAFSMAKLRIFLETIDNVEKKPHKRRKIPFFLYKKHGNRAALFGKGQEGILTKAFFMI